jgi:hypothetical protein
MLKAAELAARPLGVRLQIVEARGPADFDRAFSDMTRARAGALAVVGSGILPPMWTRFSRVRSPATCPSSNPRSSN